MGSLKTSTHVEISNTNYFRTSNREHQHGRPRRTVALANPYHKSEPNKYEIAIHILTNIIDNRVIHILVNILAIMLANILANILPIILANMLANILDCTSTNILANTK